VQTNSQQGSILPLGILPYALAGVFAFMGAVFPQVMSQDLANSRMATVFSLTEYGSFCIDAPEGMPRNPFTANTVDKVMVNGRYLSSKPPVLPLIMTAEYIALKKMFGWDLKNEHGRSSVIRVLTISLVSLAYLFSIFFFTRILKLIEIDYGLRTTMAMFLAFGTQLWGFSSFINNHVPATCMLLASICLAMGLLYGKKDPKPWRFIVFGLTAGLTITIDMPAGIWPFMAAVCLLCKYPRQTLLWATPAALIPIGVHTGVMIAITGSPLPVQTNWDYYLFENSYWRHPTGIDGLTMPKLTYLFHMTFGRAGIFILFPVLIPGLLCGITAFFKKNCPYRGAIMAAFAGFIVMTAYYCLKTNNYGGITYGFRWYIAAMPILLLMGTSIYDSLHSRWQWLIIGAMFGLSFFSAWESTHKSFDKDQGWTCKLFGTHFTP